MAYKTLSERVTDLETLTKSRDYIEIANANAVASIDYATFMMGDNSELRLMLVEIGDKILILQEGIQQIQNILGVK